MRGSFFFLDLSEQVPGPALASRNIVWAFFQDVPGVAACLPGAELVEVRADGTHLGNIAVELGPFKAVFAGEARLTVDPAALCGHLEGRGVDKRGGSHSTISLDYRLVRMEGSTRVDITADLLLAGPIAQFGRTGIVTQTADVLIGEFARNLEARISAPDAPLPAKRVNAFSVLLAAIRAWFKTAFGR